MPTVYRFDEFEVDPASFVLTRSGHPVVLEPRAFDLLCYFLEHPNRTLTKAELLDAVWTNVSVTDNVLAPAVVLVRKALGDEPRLAKYIQTVPARGYRFIARSPAIEREGAREGEASSLTVAVLPFINATGDRADEHLADGVSEDILNALAQDRTLRVAARASSFAFRDRGVDLRTVAARLNVEFVLDGSVRRIGNCVRICAQLIEAASGYHVWSQRFDRALTDIFAVQDEIATAVATSTRGILRDRLGNRLAATALCPPPSRTRPPANLEAYDAFLKGRYLSRQRFVVMGEARRHFERAISLDPTFAPAYAALSEHYGLCGLYAGLPAVDAFLGMRRFAEEARTLEPTVAEPCHLLAGVALYFEWNVAACERHLDEALAREPNHAGALTLRAILCAVRRRTDAAWASADLAIRTDPIGMETRTWVLVTAWLTRRFERQIDEADRLLADHPSYSEALRWRSMAYTACGDYGRARADLERFGAMTNRQLYYLVGLGTVAALEGKVEEAERILEEMRDRSTREWVPPMAFGHVEQQLGRYDAALDWYERACETRDFMMIALHVDPQFQIVPPGRTRPITEHPRWTALLQRIGVAPECLAVDTASRQ